MTNFFGEEIPKTVFISKDQLLHLDVGPLYGRYYPDTEIINVFPEALQHPECCLGKVLPEGSIVPDSGFCVILEAGEPTFFFDGKALKVESYELYQDIFSRNKGILETPVMMEKRAVILGCGSVGSLVAMELARAGIGHFVLVDPDIMEYHNICRHQCGIEDVGDLKVNALSRKLRNINPTVDIRTFEGVIQNIPKQILDDVCVSGETVFVGCADNRAADVYSNRISIHYGAAFVSISFWERAYAGEIFYHIPGKNMPCYACALGNGGQLSARAEANHHIYSNQENTEGVKFEPGISVDINFITNIGIKLILDILNESTSGHIPRLLGHLKQYTLVCNTSNPMIGGEMVEIFSYPLQVTTSLQVGFGPSCGGICKFEADSSAWEAAESVEDWLERVGRKLEEELDRQEGEDGI